MGSRCRARLVRASLRCALLVLHVLAHLRAVSCRPNPHLAGVAMALKLRLTMGLSLARARPLSLGLLFYRVDWFLGVVDARVQRLQSSVEPLQRLISLLSLGVRIPIRGPLHRYVP